MAHIKTWSFSRLSDFEACRYRAKLKYIDKVPEPARPLPAGKTEHANDRGTRVHTAAELYIKGGVELVAELRDFQDEFVELKALHAEGQVQLEGEWAFDAQWSPAAWTSENTWCRMKLDVYVDEGTHARVIDFKTGKKYGNEVKHAEQGQLYQLASFLKYPKLDSITVEFWYLDHGVESTTFTSYTRPEGTRYIDKFQRRGNAITSAVDFPPNPNAYSCKWCPYLGGACEYGVSRDLIKVSSKKMFGPKKGMASLFSKE